MIIKGIPRGVIPTHTIAGGVMKERMMSGQKVRRKGRDYWLDIKYRSRSIGVAYVI